jgi:type IV secretion system protein VirD4
MFKGKDSTMKRNTLVGPQLHRGRAEFNPDWKRLMCFLVAIVLGAAVATQVLANSYRYHPSLGLNLFRVYPPWSYFVWSHQWERANNHTIFAQAFGLGSLVTLGGFFLLLFDIARKNFRVNPYLHGSARWAGKKDIKAAGLLQNNGVYVGAWVEKKARSSICGTLALSTFFATLRHGAGRESA